MLEQRIQQQFFEGADLQYQIAEAMARPVAQAVEALVSTLTSGGKLLVCGLGGGAALATHLAALLVDRFERERPALAALTVQPDPRQIQALGLPGDLLLVLDPAARELDTTMAAVRAAQGKDMTVVLLAGAAGAGLRETLAESDVFVGVPHERSSRVLEALLLALHAMCDAVDVQLMGELES